MTNFFFFKVREWGGRRKRNYLTVPFNTGVGKPYSQTSSLSLNECSLSGSESIGEESMRG